MSDVKLIRLITGQDILAKTIKIDGYYELEDPLLILTIPINDPNDPNDPLSEIRPIKKEIKIAHFLPLAQSPNISIKEEHVLFDYVPVRDVIKNYIDFFGTSDLARLPKIN